MIKKLLLISLIFFMPYMLSAAISPAVYSNAKARASEVLLVKIGRVIKYRLRGNRILIKARAKVLRRYRSSRRTRYSRWITIRYITKARRSSKLLGPAPIPLLRSKQIYKAYLDRKRHYYVPAAGNHSFVPIYPHRYRHTNHRNRKRLL